jgi:hypothetical protein
MQPQSPNPQFDFMLKDQQQAGRSLMPNLPKPVKIASLAVAAIIVLIIIFSLFSGGKDNSPFAGVMARSQEISRVTAEAQKLNLQDPQTQALAATLSSALASDQKQIGAYLAKNNIKLSPTQLAADTDKTTDTTLQTASQNNGLDAAYVNYLKDALARYESDLQAAYKSAGPNGKTILSASFESTRTLLNSSPIKS